MYFTDTEFEALVTEAVNSLPPFVLEKMENVEVLVQTWPSATILKRMNLSKGKTLLGLYEGIPLTRRTSSYHLVAPDVITIFQGPIERVCGNEPDKIKKQVRHTVIHEIAHHFGISDDRLIELGAY